MSEEDKLWLLASRGDINAFMKIHDRYHGQIFNHTLKLLKSNEISTQILVESFATIWRKRNELKGVGLMEVFRSVITKRLRDEMREMHNEWLKTGKDQKEFYTWAAARKSIDRHG